MKKYVNPSLRVIEVQNEDILTNASLGVNNVKSTSTQLKGGMMYFDFEDEEF